MREVRCNLIQVVCMLLLRWRSEGKSAALYGFIAKLFSAVVDLPDRSVSSSF